MDENNIAIINSGNISAITPILKNLIQLNSKSFEFPELNQNSLRAQLWCAIFENLKNSASDDVHQLCLANIRILSRDKAQLDDVVCEKWINTLLELSGLYQLTVADDEQLPEQTPNNTTIVESLKCLCNLVFNSTSVQKMCVKNCMTEGIICRLRTYKEKSIPHDIKFFDMKLLFAITALCPQVRAKVKYEYHGFAYLTESLDEMLKEISSHNMELADDHHFMNDMQLDLSCEILKTLFNLITENKSPYFADDNIYTYTMRLVTICHSFLLCNTSSNSKRNELHNNIVNFLTGIPGYCFEEMAPVIVDNNIEITYEYEGRNMSSIHKLTEYLQSKMISTQSVINQYENLTPILTVVHKAVSGSRYIRKYVRSVILPPLKDVHTRPEEGNTIRNQLCRLLTTPITHVRDLTAEILLILCKENVGRMIKYTGYGNAAGHFANRGLLSPHKRNCENPQFSSDSDSDTEEYLAMRHTVNPVTGCYEPPRIDPMAGCSEEQKEYEAMKLVNLMDQLNRAGVIQPCRVGPDGRPEAVEHILQLQEELPNQQISNKKS